MKSKVVSLDKMVTLSKKLKNQGKSIVVYNGSFDVMHVGHISALREAKSKGNVLMVLVNSDESIRSYKGPNRPIIPQQERAALVAAIEGVDYVSIFDEITPVQALDGIKPTIYCSGSDWGKNCIERQTIEKNKGRVYVLKNVPGFSTSKLLKKIRDSFSNPVVKAVFVSAVDESIDYKALKKFTRESLKVIVLTNKSKKLANQILVEGGKSGVKIDCIEHSISTINEKIMTLLRISSKLGISLNDSWIIGDSESDVIAGRNSNTKTIKLGLPMSKNLKLEPNCYAKNFVEASEIILR